MSSSAARPGETDRTLDPDLLKFPLAVALFRPVDISFLVYVRIVFGFFMLWHVGSYFHAGAVEANFVNPPFHFTYPVFDWVRPWPAAGMYVHFFAMGGGVFYLDWFSPVQAQ